MFYGLNLSVKRFWTDSESECFEEAFNEYYIQVICLGLLTFLT